jgi:hypothetical protein
MFEFFFCPIVENGQFQMESGTISRVHKSCKTLSIGKQWLAWALKGNSNIREYPAMGWRKLKPGSLARENSFAFAIFAEFAEAGKRRNKAVHLLEKRVISMIRLLILVSDWPIIMIDPGGLLLVLPPPMPVRLREIVLLLRVCTIGWGRQFEAAKLCSC